MPASLSSNPVTTSSMTKRHSILFFRISLLAVALVAHRLPAQDSTPAVQARSVPQPAAPVDPTFVNSLGMKFVAVPGTMVSFCVWETRKQDFEVFAKSRPGGDSTWKNSSFKGQPVSFATNHPVVNVSWDDAKAFCAWLTQKERSEGRIHAEAIYRLPTDREWSTAVGLPLEEGATPKERDRKVTNVYPWGKQFPPPQGAGNYGDLSSRVAFGPDWAFIPGYDDGFSTTAPVGSARENQHGLFDMGGNVWEWCEDLMDVRSDYRVTRGGCWVNAEAEYLLSSARNGRLPDFRRHAVGFRVVLTKAPAK